MQHASALAYHFACVAEHRSPTRMREVESPYSSSNSTQPQKLDVAACRELFPAVNSTYGLGVWRCKHCFRQ